jgi:hypothetical protein
MSGSRCLVERGGLEVSGAVLFVRSPEEVRRAVSSASGIYSRQAPGEPSGGELLGIIVTGEVDLGIRLSAEGGPRSVDVGVRMRASVSLAGVWHLCWFDFSLSESPDCSEGRRRRLLELLLPRLARERTASMARRVFIAVLSPEEAEVGVEVILDALEAQFPGVEVGRRCFVSDTRRRGFVPCARGDSSVSHVVRRLGDSVASESARRRGS